jgi:hypothetical protein
MKVVTFFAGTDRIIYNRLHILREERYYQTTGSLGRNIIITVTERVKNRLSALILMNDFIEHASMCWD